MNGGALSLVLSEISGLSFPPKKQIPKENDGGGQWGAISLFPTCLFQAQPSQYLLHSMVRAEMFSPPAWSLPAAH